MPPITQRWDFDKEAFVLENGDFSYWKFMPEYMIWVVKLDDGWHYVHGTDKVKFLFFGTGKVPDDLVKYMPTE